MRCRWCIPLLIGSLCASLSPRRTAAQIPPGRETKLEAPAGRIFDLFGQAVALSPDDVAVVGAPADDSAATNAGAAYVFERTDGAWVLRAMLLAADAAPEDYFGRSVAVSDETILVGAPLDSNQGLFQAGSAYVFVRTGVATWAQQAKLVSTDQGWVKAGSVCSGTVFEIGEPFQLPPLLLETDENGFATGILTLQNDRCWLEALAFLRCETSPAVRVP